MPFRSPCTWDRYDDSAFDEGISEYDQRRHERMPIPPDKQRQVERFGQSEFYGWSEDKARQVAESERADFGAYVRAQSFNLE